jgi:hypothetical protein
MHVKRYNSDVGLMVVQGYPLDLVRIGECYGIIRSTSSLGRLALCGGTEKVSKVHNFGLGVFFVLRASMCLPGL